MSFTFTINGNTYTSDPANTTVPDGYRFIKYGYILALANLAQDIVTVMTQKVQAAADQVGLATASAAAAATSAATATNAAGTAATSTTSNTIALGSTTVTIQAGKAISAGMQIRIASSASPTNWMDGTCTAYNSGTGSLTINVTNISGSGTFSSWNVSLSGAPGTAGVVNELLGVPIASAATINLNSVTGNLVHVTGTTPISAITLASGAERTVIFDGVLTLTNSASLLLPGGANITTAVNDRMIVRGDTAGVIVVDYAKANGLPVINQGIIPIGSLMAFDSDVANGQNTYTAPNGDQYLKTGVIADTSVYPNAPAAPWGSISSGAPVTAPASTPQSLVYGNGVFLCGIYSGQFQRSTDGSNWSAATQLTGFTGYVTIAFGNGYFVAIDSNLTGKVAKSTDGINWTYGTTGIASGTPTALAYGGGVWVAAASATTGIYTSTDGLTWTPRTNSRTFTATTNMGVPLAWNGSLFVLIDLNTTTAQYSTSPDGINWTNRAITAPTVGFYGIAYGNGSFVICGNEGLSANVIRQSTDGINWNTRTSGAPTSTAMGVAYLGNKFVFCDGSNSYTSADGITWTQTAGGNHANVPRVYASSGTVHVGATISGAFNRSENLLNWLLVGALAVATSQLTYGNGRWLVAQSTASNTGVSFSYDGIAWVQGWLPTTDNWTQLNYFNGLYVASGASNYYTSPDFYNWTSRTIPTNLNGGFWVANGRLYSLSNNNTTGFSYSADGLTFANAAFADAKTWQGVVYGNLTYLVYDQLSAINTSTDGLSWTSRTSGFSGNIAGVVFASGFFIAATVSGNMYKSADGITWTQLTQGYGIATGVDALVTDGTKAIATSSGNAAILIWPGTGNYFYRRVTSGVFGGGSTKLTAMNSSTIVSRVASAYTYYVATIAATNKVLNDTNFKTYNATAALQTDFYKRVA